MSESPILLATKDEPAGTGDPRPMECIVCGAPYVGLRAGDDCERPGCTGAVYFDVPDEEVQHV
jgi:hypothetical protein